MDGRGIGERGWMGGMDRRGWMGGLSMAGSNLVCRKRRSSDSCTLVSCTSAATCTVTFVVDMCSCMQLDLCYGFEL